MAFGMRKERLLARRLAVDGLLEPRELFGPRVVTRDLAANGGGGPDNIPAVVIEVDVP